MRCHHAYRTSLYFAVRENQMEVARFLLERGADPLSLAVNDSLVPGESAMIPVEPRTLSDTLWASCGVSWAWMAWRASCASTALVRGTTPAIVISGWKAQPSRRLWPR